MRRIALLGALPTACLLALLPGWAAADGWVALDGPKVTEALTGRTVIYDGGTWQSFRASGRTLYNAGQDSWGYWGVRGDRYCSMWPPSDLWACYDVEQAGDAIRFVGEGGDDTLGRYAE